MYEGHFNLTSDPFRLLPDPGICFPHKSCARAWSYLRYAVKRGEGIVVVIGPPGSGKTTLADRLLKELNPSKTVSARLIAHDLSPTDLLRKLAYAFGLPAEGMDRAMLAHRIERYLFGLEQTNRRALVVIDEAQTLSNPALEAMRLLTDLQSRSNPVLQLILMGQPELEAAMSAPGMEQFQHRVIASCRLLPMDLTETKAYLEYRLDHAGWRGDPTFDGPAVMAIYRHSGGLPRHVNKIGSRLLLHASSEDIHALTEREVLAVVRDLRDELIAPKDTGGSVELSSGEIPDSVYELVLVPNTRPSTSGRPAARSLTGLYPKDEASKPRSRPRRAVPSVPPRVQAEEDAAAAARPARRAPQLPKRPARRAISWRRIWRVVLVRLRTWGGQLRAAIVDRLEPSPRHWPVASLGILVAVGLAVAVWQSGAGYDPDDAEVAEVAVDQPDPAGREILATPSGAVWPGATSPKGPDFETALVGDSTAELVAREIPGSLAVSSDLMTKDMVDQLVGVDQDLDRVVVSRVGDDVAVSFFGAARTTSVAPDPAHALGPSHTAPAVAKTEQAMLAAAEIAPTDKSLAAQSLSLSESSPAVRPATAEDVPAAPLGQAPDAIVWSSDTEPASADLANADLVTATVGVDGLEEGGSLGVPSGGPIEPNAPRYPALDSDGSAVFKEQREAQARAEVERLAALAERAMVRYRFLLPKKDSAYVYYQRILALEPENAVAAAGLDRIVGKYREISSKALGENDFDKAKLYVARALRVNPHDADALALRRAIDDAISDAELARRTAIELEAIEREALRLSQLRQKAVPPPKKELSNFERLMLSVEGRAQ